VSEHYLNDVIEAYRKALPAFLHGDPEPVLALFSRRDDVTLANPFGPPHRGPADVEHAIRTAASNFKAGTVRFEEVSRYGTADLGYVVQLEPSEVQLADTNNTVRISLRVTMIFRREEDTWRVAHRHADPITTARPITSAIET
jgi:ketosteroid isomerase-like protein